jgi:hypothetical protein
MKNPFVVHSGGVDGVRVDRGCRSCPTPTLGRLVLEARHHDARARGFSPVIPWQSASLPTDSPRAGAPPHVRRTTELHMGAGSAPCYTGDLVDRSVEPRTRPADARRGQPWTTPMTSPSPHGVAASRAAWPKRTAWNVRSPAPPNCYALSRHRHRRYLTRVPSACPVHVGAR